MSTPSVLFDPMVSPYIRYGTGGVDTVDTVELAE